jgi:hypothetical protein
VDTTRLVPVDPERMVLSAMDCQSKAAIDDRVSGRSRPPGRSVFDGVLARAREALEGLGGFESADLIRAERDGHRLDRDSEDGR